MPNRAAALFLGLEPEILRFLRQSFSLHHLLKFFLLRLQLHPALIFDLLSN